MVQVMARQVEGCRGQEGGAGGTEGECTCSWA